jgi:hypothetical protein
MRLEPRLTALGMLGEADLARHDQPRALVFGVENGGQGFACRFRRRDAVAALDTVTTALSATAATSSRKKRCEARSTFASSPVAWTSMRLPLMNANVRM